MYNRLTYNLNHLEMKRTLFNYKALSNTESDKLVSCEREIQTRLINQKYDAYEIGQLLNRAKQVLQHGSYKIWIETTFEDDLPYSTAYLFHKVYLTFKDNPGIIQYIPTQYLAMFSQNKFPNKTLKLIQQKLNENPKAITTKQLKTVDNLYTQLKSGTIGGSVFNKHSKAVIELGKELSKNQVGRTKHRINRVMRRPLYLGLGDMLKRINSTIKTAKETSGLFPHDPTSKEHRDAVNYIKKTIDRLQNLLTELEGGDGFFKELSTPEGPKFI